MNRITLNMIPQGCISIERGGRRYDLHIHPTHGFSPGVGDFVLVEDRFVEHEGYQSVAHLYDPKNGDPAFDYTDSDVTLYDGCTPSRR